jgi:hypothetical protein
MKDLELWSDSRFESVQLSSLQPMNRFVSVLPLRFKFLHYRELKSFIAAAFRQSLTCFYCGFYLGGTFNGAGFSPRVRGQATFINAH